MSLIGKCALVTGSARGIGLVTARALCRQGMAVAINDLAAAEAKQAAPRATGRLPFPPT